jgi:hypothetical protein
VAGEGADFKHPVLLPDVAELAVELVDVYENLGEGQPQLHHRDQAVPPCQKPGLRPVPLQKAYRLVHGVGHLILKLSRHLHKHLPFPRNCHQAERII